MRTYLMLPAAILGFASLLVTGGCADEQARKTQDLLKAQELKNQKLEAEAKASKGIIESKDLTIAAKDQQLASLQATNTQLKKDYADLKSKYDRLTAAGPAKPGDMAAKDKQIAALKADDDKAHKDYTSLKAAHDKLQKTYNDLKAKYDKLTAPKKPAPKKKK